MVSMASPMPVYRFVCPEFIGREKEQARLSESLSTAAQGNGAVVLIAGEAGIGGGYFHANARLPTRRALLSPRTAAIGRGRLSAFASRGR